MAICSRLLLAGAALLALGSVYGRTQSDPNLQACSAAGADKRIDVCTRAIDSGKLAPADLATASNLRGVAWLERGDLTKAHADFDAAMQQNPNDAWARNNRGIVHRQRGELDDAIADFDTALRLRPGYAFALVNRGAVRLAKGDPDRAIADLDAAIAQNPPQAEVALKTRGDARLAKGDYVAAIADFGAAIQRKPDYASAYIGRAYARFCQGAFDAAAADFIMARQHRQDVESAVGLVIASLRGGHDGQADIEETSKNFESGKDMPPGLALFGGALSPEQTLQAASDPNPRTQRRRACAANFQVGQWYILQLDTARARLHLSRARETCDKSLPEYAGAVAELARLK